MKAGDLIVHWKGGRGTGGGSRLAGLFSHVRAEFNTVRSGRGRLGEGVHPARDETYSDFSHFWIGHHSH